MTLEKAESINNLVTIKKLGKQLKPSPNKVLEKLFPTFKELLILCLIII